MVEGQVYEQLDDASKRLEPSNISFLQELVRTPSTNPPGDYEEIHATLTRHLTANEWEVETLWAPDELIEELGLEHPRPNVLAWMTRGDGPTIALRSHFDTAPVDESLWDFDPFGGRIEDGVLYGRGATDEKGQIASHVLAARILEESGLLPEEATIVLVCDADEETDGKAGAGYVSSTGAIDPDYVFGQGVIDQIWSSGLGFVQYRVDVEGASSHAGVNPDNSANPNFGAARLLRAIEEYSATHLREESGGPSMDDPTCTPTALTSNGDVSIVPETTTFFIDQRHPTGYDQRELIQDLTRTLETTDLPPRTDVTVTVVDRAEPYHHGQDEEHVAVLHRNANAYFEEEIPVVGTRSSGGRDPDPRWPYRPPKTHYYASLGAKCIHFGPGSITNNIHGPDEFLHVSEVREVGLVLAASVLDLLG